MYFIWKYRKIEPYARYPTSFVRSLCISIHKCSFLFVHLHCFEYYVILCVSLIPGRPYIPWPLFCFKYHFKDSLQEFWERKQNFPDTLFAIPELSGSAIHVWSLASGNSGVFLAPIKSTVMWPMWSLQSLREASRATWRPKGTSQSQCTGPALGWQDDATVKARS